MVGASQILSIEVFRRTQQKSNAKHPRFTRERFTYNLLFCLKSV